MKLTPRKLVPFGKVRYPGIYLGKEGIDAGWNVGDRVILEVWEDVIVIRKKKEEKP